MKNLKSFTLIIIESLSANEMSGKDLFSSVIRKKIFKEPGLNAEYFDINNSKEFFRLLKKLVKRVIEQNDYFIFHFEIHGYDGGIQLKNKENINWADLLPYFRKINIHYRNTLTIYLVVCKGATLIKEVNPMERAPFRVLVSSEKDLYEKHFIKGFVDFYEHYFFSFDAKESLEKYNKNVDESDDELTMLYCEHFFDQITNFNRSSIDYNSMILSYKNTMIEKGESIDNLKDDEILKKIEYIFNDMATKKDYFMMKDLK